VGELSVSGRIHGSTGSIRSTSNSIGNRSFKLPSESRQCGKSRWAIEEKIMISRKFDIRFLPRTIWAAPFVLAAFIGSAPQARPLECPVPQKLSRPGVLKETPTQIAVVGAFLASGESDKTVPLVEADLRARYPGVEDAELVNYLVTAFCPVVNKMTGMSDAEKQARMNRFGQDLMRMTY
jgi:hypothetical protein